MQKVSLSGSPRANVGKKDASDLRKAGNVPCVIYGGKEQISFSVPEIDLKKIVWNPNVYQIDLNLGDKVIPAIIKDIQFHTITDRVTHVDFLELIPGKSVKVKLPVRLQGTSEGVKKGGKLVQNFRKISVWGTPETLPDFVSVNIDTLDIGGMIRVRDIAAEGIRFMEAPEAVVVAVKTTRNVATAADEKGDSKKK